MILAALIAASGSFQVAPCALEGVPAGYEQKHAIQCGWVTVPLHNGQAGGKAIRLWTARVRGTGAARGDDPVLYINGGPGIATVDSILPYLDESKAMALLREGRDLILFDQRGSGRSEEQLCPDLAKTVAALEGEGLEPAAEAERERQEYARCRAEVERQGSDLKAYTTAATVADMEVIRRAFNIERWNLAGISYGTLVALHAMRTHPGSIRSVILNSPFPPNSATWAEQSSSAVEGFAAIDRECSAQPACKARFGALLPKLEATLQRLEKAPIRDGAKLITGRQFARAIWPLAVRSSTVKYVPLAIDRAHSGDVELTTKMVAAFAGGGSFGGYSPAQAHAIGCHESGRTKDWYVRARRLYPTMVAATPADSWDRLCATYRPGFADPAFFAPVASDIPTLIYAGSLDLATPTVDAYQTTRFLTRATLVEVRGASHGPMVEDDCTAGIARRFLAAPSGIQNVTCLASRPVTAFATDGLDQLLAPPK